MEETILEVGSIFIGIGAMVVFFVLAYLLYQFSRIIKATADKEWKYELFEEMMLDKVAMKKGINLDKEMLKRDAMKIQRKSLRRKLADEIYDEMFGKDKEEKKE